MCVCHTYQRLASLLCWLSGQEASRKCSLFCDALEYVTLFLEKKPPPPKKTSPELVLWQFSLSIYCVAFILSVTNLTNLLL